MPRFKKAISLRKLKQGWAAGLFLLIVSAPFAHAQETAATIDVRLTRLEKRLADIDANLKKILEKEEELLEKLDTVKIWARRS